MEPLFTEDLDIIVLVDSDDEYLEVFRKMQNNAEGMEGMHLIFGDTPVQPFPSTTKPIYRDSVDKAIVKRIGNIRIKVVGPEHLIMLYLESFRERDKARIQNLLSIVDIKAVKALLLRFDDAKGSLTKKFQSVR